MTQNSVLSQNCVKCTVCTPMAQAARTLRTGLVMSRRVVAWPGRVMAWPPLISWLHLSRVAARTGCVAGRVVRYLAHYLARRATPCRSACPVVSQGLSAVSQAPSAVSWIPCGRIVGPYRGLSHDTPNSQAMRTGSARRPTVSRTSWPCRGAVSQG